MTTNPEFRTLLAVELARRGMTQRDLAERMNVPPTTLSDWLTGAHPARPNLRESIERALRLPPGTLLGANEPPNGGPAKAA